jgi:hypothetical protein
VVEECQFARRASKFDSDGRLMCLTLADCAIRGFDPLLASCTWTSCRAALPWSRPAMRLMDLILSRIVVRRYVLPVSHSSFWRSSNFLTPKHQPGWWS